MMRAIHARRLAGRQLVFALALCAGHDVGAQTTDSSAHAPSYPAVVNDSLNLDWHALNGVSEYYEYQSGTYSKQQVQVDFSFAISSTGDSLLEQVHHTVQFRTNGLRIFQNAHEQVHIVDSTVLTLKGALVQRAEQFETRSAVEGSAAPYTYALILANDSAVVHSGAWVLGSKVPHGAILQSGLTGAIAALPDSLRDSVTIWLVRSDSAGISVHWVTLKFGKTVDAGVPIADDGARCDHGTKTHTVQMKAVKVKATNRYGTTEYEVLARQPHFLIQSQLKCITIPGVS